MAVDADGVNRTPITIPGTGGVISVPDEQLDERLAGGYKKVRASRRADTGTVPVQQSSPSSSTSSSSSR